jgi:hypothetical protein
MERMQLVDVPGEMFSFAASFFLYQSINQSTGLGSFDVDEGTRC